MKNLDPSIAERHDIEPGAILKKSMSSSVEYDCVHVGIYVDTQLIYICYVLDH